MPEDFVEKLMAQIRAAAPDLPSDRVSAIARQVRLDWGGSTVYIKKAPAEGKARSLGLTLAAGVPLAQAFADIGISRRTGYRLLSRRWPGR